VKHPPSLRRVALRRDAHAARRTIPVHLALLPVHRHRRAALRRRRVPRALVRRRRLLVPQLLESLCRPVAQRLERGAVGRQVVLARHTRELALGTALERPQRRLHLLRESDARAHGLVHLPGHVRLVRGEGRGVSD